MSKNIQPQQLNLRSTLPSMLNKKFKLICPENSDNKQKMLSDTSLNFIPTQEVCSNAFFVRVSPQNLNDQNLIYDWRIKCSSNIVGIKSVKLQSEGNRFNPNSLLKIELQIPKSNFSFIKNINLTKCISMLKSSLKGLQQLLEYFQPIIFTDKMIYVSQESDAKIWMDQRFYINPNNQLYSKKQNEKISQFQSLKSLISVFEAKCLKTKLSFKLFQLLAEQQTLNDALNSIITFEMQENLFYISASKNSISTSPGLTMMNTSLSLEFSPNSRQNKKHKQNSPKKKCKSNYSNQKFLQAKSMQINPIQNCFMKKKRDQITSKSHTQQVQQLSDMRIPIVKSLNPQLIDKSAQSMVVSQIFKQIYYPQINQQIEKKPSLPQLQKISFNFSSLGEQFKQYNFNFNPKNSQSDFSFQQNEEQQQLELMQSQKRLQIMNENGWNNGLGSLFDKMKNVNVKQSFSVGTQQHTPIQFKLKKLHTMGKQVVESFLPVGQQSFDEY